MSREKDEITRRETLTQLTADSETFVVIWECDFAPSKSTAQVRIINVFTENFDYYRSQV